MLLAADNLHKSFQGATAVAGVSFELEAGETLALIGPSGCGKTTTLKMLNRLVEPDEGVVRLGGREAHEVEAHIWRRRIGYVIQSAGLFPHRSVADNVAATPQLLEWDDDRIAVMDAGGIAQIGAAEDLIANPAGPAVEAMLAAPRRTARAVSRAFAGALD